MKMSYIILEDFEIKNLQEKVNRFITKEYRPIGGVAAIHQKDGFIEYLQAMVKEAD